MTTEVLVKVRLDRTAPGHYEPGAARPCRCCGTPTHERDRDGRPCMKGCAEDEIARELLGAARARIADEGMPSPAGGAR
jgi:hypothetical protein